MDICTTAKHTFSSRVKRNLAALRRSTTTVNFSSRVTELLTTMCFPGLSLRPTSENGIFAHKLTRTIFYTDGTFRNAEAPTFTLWSVNTPLRAAFLHFLRKYSVLDAWREGSAGRHRVKSRL